MNTVTKFFAQTLFGTTLAIIACFTVQNSMPSASAKPAAVGVPFESDLSTTQSLYSREIIEEQEMNVFEVHASDEGVLELIQLRYDITPDPLDGIKSV